MNGKLKNKKFLLIILLIGVLIGGIVVIGSWAQKSIIDSFSNTSKISTSSNLYFQTSSGIIKLKKSSDSSTTCTTNDECSSGFCVDGYCCNSTCGDVCKACGNPGSAGTCGYISQTVTFDKNGGTTEADPTSRITNCGTTVTLPTAPTKTGYTFASWNTAANGSGTTFTASTAVTADITVYAQWNAPCTTPTFNPNSGAIALNVTTITLSSDSGTTIHYTTDGSTPTTGSPSVATGATITLPSVANPIKALAVKSGYPNSSVGTSGTYTQAATANLSGLAISDSPGNYTFAEGTYSYPVVTSLATVAHIHVTPTGSGTITVDGTTVASGVASGEITLTAGTEKSIPIIATETGKTAKTYTIKITRIPAIGGDLQGGKLAYLDGTNLGGFIAATADQSTGIIWAVAAYQSTAVTGADGTAIGTGNQNTIDIVTQNGTDSTFAAGLCSNLSLGGYDDWYLPSRDELAQLRINRVAIGGFTNLYYWSSSEGGAYDAWAQYFSTGNQNGHTKSVARYVRAIRAF
jgi:uncharacterized repeat protein (TIGR02543 family)